jgi:hypothetical protein
MLFVPLAAAAGMTAVNEKGKFDAQKLRANLKLTIESTTLRMRFACTKPLTLLSPAA